MNRPVSLSALRNQDVICEVLKNILPASGTALEVGSGTGQHITHFAKNLPSLTFQPTERNTEALENIQHRINGTGYSNVKSPLFLDLLDEDWPVNNADAVISINVIHIAPWPATVALLRLAARILPSGAPLFFYGPFLRNDIPTVESNINFDRSLRSNDPASGLRNLDEITIHALEFGFTEPEITPMPSNNLSAVFTKVEI